MMIALVLSNRSCPSLPDVSSEDDEYFGRSIGYGGMKVKKQQKIFEKPEVLFLVLELPSMSLKFFHLQKKLRMAGTLIVCPMSLLDQWRDEFHTHAPKMKLSIGVYHSHEKVSFLLSLPLFPFSLFTIFFQMTTVEELLRCDVILTTYGTLSSEIKKKKKKKGGALATATNQITSLFHSLSKDSGGAGDNGTVPLLLRVNFSRIVRFFLCSFCLCFLHPLSCFFLFFLFFKKVLDEAHFIKSSFTNSFWSVSQLRGCFRWCLTGFSFYFLFFFLVLIFFSLLSPGTPIQNKVDDIYSLLHFLHVTPWSDYYWWNKVAFFSTIPILLTEHSFFSFLIIFFRSLKPLSKKANQKQ